MSQRSRWNHKGRSAGPSFIQIPHYVLDSPQWAELPGYGLKLLMELARQYRGKNNGDLSAAWSVLRKRGWRSETTLDKYLEMLEARGWIVKTRQGGRHIGCSLFAVTWWPVDECGGKHQHPAERKPSHLWKNGIGTPETGVRYPQKLESKGLKLQKLEGEPVPLRPAA